MPNENGPTGFGGTSGGSCGLAVRLRRRVQSGF